MARYESGQAIVRAFGENNRAIGYATHVAKRLVDRSGHFHLATIVDGSRFDIRGFVEGHYGAPMTTSQRQCLVDRMAMLRANVYLYGPKGDPYAHQQWADPYPADEAAALADTAARARARHIDFAWAVSPGLPSGYPAPGTSISYASDADFARLTAKIDAMSALGIDRFALFLDDIDKTLVYDADRAAFATPTAAHVALANRLDAYVTAAGAPHLLFVGPYYTNKFAGWQAWASEVGDTLAPGIDVMWTGPAVYPASMHRLRSSPSPTRSSAATSSSGTTSRARRSRSSEYSPGLPGAARGFLSNTIMLQTELRLHVRRLLEHRRPARRLRLEPGRLRSRSLAVVVRARSRDDEPLRRQQRHFVARVEAFVVAGRLEPLVGDEQRHVGHARFALARAIARQAVGRRRP